MLSTLYFLRWGNYSRCSFIDLRSRFLTYIQLANGHLLAITAAHTGEDVCNLVARRLAAVIGVDWNKKLVVIYTVGAASMVGHISGAVTVSSCHVSCLLWRSSAGSSRARFFQTTIKMCFQQPRFALVSYNRRQTNLKAEVGIFFQPPPLHGSF